MKKILIVGRERSLLNDVAEFIPAAYEMSRCNVSYKPLDEALFKDKPDMVLVCLDAETDDSVKLYTPLLTADAEIIISGKKRDCIAFQKAVPLSEVKMINRPFTGAKLVEELAKYVDGCTDLKDDDVDLEFVFEDDSTMEELKAAEIQMKDLSGDKLMDDLMSLVTDFKEKKHILVVDDDVNMLKIIKTFLEERYIVHVAPNGKIAEKFLKANTVQLILLDYVMPEKTGSQVFKELRDNPTTASIPVIFLTGVSERHKIEEIIDNKPAGYILKPVNKGKLLNRVNEVMSRYTL